MNVYITKINGMGNTMQFLQHMTAEIAHSLGIREMGVYYYNANAEKPEQRSVRFDGIIAGMQAGDIVICQFHTWNGLRFERALVEHVKAYRGRIIIFIHSLEALMIRSSRFMLEETVELYNQAEALIVSSYEMKRFLLNSGIRSGMKFIIQEMWDWTTGIHFWETPKFRREICYMGSADSQLAKAWNYDIALRYCGTFRPDELMIELSKGGFGLEWYHDKQAYEYRYGNSFSLSRYLAAGIPVIVPFGISCQKLIEENHLGLVADSLEEAVTAVREMNEAEYQEYVHHVGAFAPALRNGYYTRKCLIEAVCSLFRDDIGKTYVQEDVLYDVDDLEFTTVSLKESYGGNLALSWDLKGRPDGFLIYDASGRLVDEIENIYQHYLLLKDQGREEGFIVKAYVNTRKGKMIAAKSALASLEPEQYKAPLVSMIIPAYNAEADVARTVDTILAQSFSNLEIVAVDDGSSDHTPDILGWYAEKYPNIKVIHQKNMGVQAARNTGIMHAKGEYMGFVDSNDMIRPNMVEGLYICAKTNDCDIAVTSIYQMDRKGYMSMMQYKLEEDRALTTETFFQEYISSGGCALPALWNKLYRTSLVRERLLPLIRFEDEAWTPYILSYADKICYLDLCAYEYDRNSGGGKVSLVDEWSYKSKEEVFQDHKRSILFYLEHGNPKMRNSLKEVAKEELRVFGKVLAYEGYEELRKQVVEME